MSEPASPSVAVLLPCYNEEHTIAGVVAGFRAALPDAQIYVYDNNSTDFTAHQGARRRRACRARAAPGQGQRGRRMFADIEADIYLMADGDGTYAAEDAPQLVNTLLTERADMVVGDPARRHRRCRPRRPCLRQPHLQPPLQGLVRARLHRYLFRLSGLLAALRQELPGGFGRLRDRDGNVGACLAC